MHSADDIEVTPYELMDGLMDTEGDYDISEYQDYLARNGIPSAS